MGYPKSESLLGARAYHDFAKTNGLEASATHVMPGGPSLTRQEFADECDINNIMKQYEKHLADPMRSVREPMYIDFTELPDTLMGTMAMLHQATAAFMTLPADVRREFDNDATRFMDFMSDPALVEENKEALRDYGLLAPEEPVQAPMRVEVVNQQPVFKQAVGARQGAPEAPDEGA